MKEIVDQGTNSQELLKIFTLGGLSIFLEARPVGGFASRKAEALLVYLACTNNPQLREVLAELLWDERPQNQAKSNLRVVLSSLRKQLAPYLFITRDIVALNQDDVIWVDALEMENLVLKVQNERRPSLRPAAVEQLEQAVALYHGKFLDGFFIRKCTGFESWHLREQERLHQVVLEALNALVYHYLAIGEYPIGIGHASRLLELDPLMETTHQQLMRLLAYNGQRMAALKQFETCSQILDAELGLQPAEPTVKIYQQILNGELLTPVPINVHPYEISPLPTFLDQDYQKADPVRPVFVDREEELHQLHMFLESALQGQSRVVFITGEAGSGKTALMLEFAYQAQEKFTDLVVALGNCSDYSRSGDPYQPFRDVLGMLTGDIESKWASTTLTQAHAQRLWSLIPASIQALMSYGSDLIDVFVSSTELVKRVSATTTKTTSWLEQLQALSDRQKPATGNLEQSHLFKQYTNVLQALAKQKPLLVMLDDLHWADSASINLLFHLGRELTGSPILIIGTYRPEEFALGRDGHRHPLEKALAELKRRYGKVWVDLDHTDKVEDSNFVESFLDSEPNRLGDSFRQALYKHTRGHPLFTIELLHDLQRRGDLIKDKEGLWVEGAQLDWSVLPARVEGIIEERIARLDERLYEILRIASVVGVNFYSQVVGWVLNIGERELVHLLSRELDKKHHLIDELGSHQMGDWQLFMYRFRHRLFQQHLYNQIGEVEKQLLHADVGVVLESIYGEHVEQISAQLARHFTKAGEPHKAVHYLVMTGDRARQFYAHEEAIENYQRALQYLKEQGEYDRAAHILMKIGLTYHTAFNYPRSRLAYEEGSTFWQRAEKSKPMTGASHQGHTLRLDWEMEPVTLDPGKTLDRPTSQLIDLLFSSLVELSPDFDVEPDIASSWDVLDGGCKYIFHLRDDVRWSDGVPVTAGDFVCAWIRTLNPENKISITAGLFDIKRAKDYKYNKVNDPATVGVRALDDFTLEVELEGPTGFFPYLLTQPICNPIPKHKVEQYGDDWCLPENLVTNGPYRLEELIPGGPIALVLNHDYHGGFSGNVQRLELVLISKPLDRLNEYEADGLDVLRLEPDIEFARQKHTGELVSSPSLITSYLGFKLRRPPFNELRVRQAFAMSVNRRTLAESVLKGFHDPATGGFVPPGLPGHSEGIGISYDPDKARYLLAQAGYPSGRGFPTVLLQAHQGNRAIAEFLQSQWLINLHIKVEVIILDWALFLQNLDSTHLLLSRWVADYPDPDNFLRVALSRRIGEWDQHYQYLVEKARHITDQAERMKLYNDADQILIQKVAIMPLTYAKSNILVKPWVKQLVKSPLDYWSSKDALVESMDS